jgi:WD40 repeat protein
MRAIRKPRRWRWPRVLLAALTMFSCLLPNLASPAMSAMSSPVFAPAPGSPFKLPGYGGEVEFSPNGRLLAVGSDRVGSNGRVTSTITVFAVEARGHLALLQRFAVAHSDISLGPFTPDGKSVLICEAGNDDRVWIHAVTPHGIGPTRWQGHAGNFYCAGSFSPSGRVLALDRGSLTTYSVEPTGALRHIPGTPFPFGFANALAFSPLGSFIALTQPNTDGSPRESVSLYSVTSAGVPSKTPLSSMLAGPGMGSVVFSPDGQLVAALSYSGPSHAIWLYHVESSGALTSVAGSPFETDGGDIDLAFSADGTLLAVTDEASRHVVLFAVQPDGSLHRLPDLTTAHSTNLGPVAVAFIPTEHRLAVVNRADETVSVFAYR